MATFPAKLVTPERVVLEDEVQAVMLRTDLGDAAFLPGHTPLIGAIVPGLVRFQAEDGTEKRFEVERGLVRVEPDGVVVLVPEAEPST
jgi:F-type H+-transporting ATPase subunit epsilon